MTPVSLNEDFVDLLRELDAAGVEYVVVGAHALAVHGYPRATGDLDVLVNPTEANAARVVAALEAFGAPLRSHGASISDFTTPGTVYQLGLPPRRIDVLTRISGVPFPEARSGAVSVQVEGVPVPVLGLRELKRNKAASGRPKDAVDLAVLAAAERPQAD